MLPYVVKPWGKEILGLMGALIDSAQMSSEIQDQMDLRDHWVLCTQLTIIGD